jgi:hypothetical protein
MSFFLVLIVALLLAGPAAADPATLLITALGGQAALGVVGAALVRIGVGLALSALGQALAAKRSRGVRTSGGIKTDVTTAGGVTPQSFILGRYATRGNVVAPFYAHGDVGGISNAYRTQIIDLSDMPVTGLNALWIDGRRFTIATDFAGPTHPDYGMGANPTTRAKYAGKVWLKFYDGTQTTADAMLVAKYGSHSQRPWTTAMIGRGVAYAILTYKYDTTVWRGEPQVLFEVDGIRLYDWRKDSTAGGSGAHRWANPATWEFSLNPVVMAYNVLRGVTLPDGDVFGLVGLTAADLPISYWTAAANTSDGIVSGAARYRAGYEVVMATPEDGGQAPLDVVDELMLACSGSIADLGGAIAIRVGAPSLAVAAITDEDILRDRPQDLDPFKGLAETYNAVRASFPDPAQQWQAREAPPRYDSAAETADGRRLVANLSIPAAPYQYQIQRLMLAWLKDARRMRRHTVTLSPDFLYLGPLDVFEWTSTRNGYIAKLFDVSKAAVDPRSLSVTLAAREVDPTDYDWTGGDEIAVGAPSDVVIEVAADPVPGFAVAGISIQDAAGNNRRPAIRITWTTDLPGVTGIRYQVRLTTTSVAVADGFTGNVDDGQKIVSDGILPAISYQVRAKLLMSRPTVWTAWTSVTTPAVFISAQDFSGGAIPAVDLSGVLDISQFATTIRPIEVVAALPATGNFQGRTVFHIPTNKIYRHTGSPTTAAGFTVSTDGADILANSIVAGKIAAGAIGATEIAANQIAARHLAIGDFENYLTNGAFQSGNFDTWSAIGAGFSVVPQGPSGAAATTTMPALNAASVAADGLLYQIDYAKAIPVKELTWYWLSMDIACGGSSPSTSWKISIFFNDNTNSFLSAPSTTQVITTSTWANRVAQIQAPAGATGIYRIRVERLAGAVGSSFITNIAVRRMNAGELTVDGTVRAQHMAADSITAGNAAIANAAVNTLQIAGQAVTVAQNGFTTTPQTITATETDAITVTLTRVSGFQTEIAVSVCFNDHTASGTSGFSVFARIYRGATFLFLAAVTTPTANGEVIRSAPITYTFVDTDTAGGSTTYKITLAKSGVNNIPVTTSAFISARQFKR